jgi:hypothetical protein
LDVVKKPVIQYICLSTLFLISVSYQVRVTEFRFPSWFGQSSAVAWPFYIQTGPDGILIGFLTPEATGAGLHDHDYLLAINSRPVTGTAVYGEALAAAHPGNIFRITVRPNESGQVSAEKTVEIRLTPINHNEVFAAVLLFVVMPVLCLFIGF